MYRRKLGLPIMGTPSLRALNIEYLKRRKANRQSLTERNTVGGIERTCTDSPLVSIIVPVYNVNERWLRRMLGSVLAQTHGGWELCLVDDGSTQPHVRSVLREFAAADPRIKVTLLQENKGISEASNEALRLATGQYVGLLDHDDELDPEALEEIMATLARWPETDLVYTDEDKYVGRKSVTIDPFFKPAWSPELLRSMNYITHFSVFRRGIIEEVGGFRRGFEGSQDYDLLLRVTELTANIRHIPKVLYHWRAIPGSAAASATAKPYAYQAARAALKEALDRSGEGGLVETISPGRYRVRYELEKMGKVAIVRLPSWIGRAGPGKSDEDYNAGKKDLREELENHLPFKSSGNDWAHAANEAATRSDAEYLLFCDSDIHPVSAEWVVSLLEHAQRSEVCAVGGTVVGEREELLEAGLILDDEQLVTPAFQGLNAREPGYFGLAEVVRNCSAVTGACMMLRAKLLRELGGFDELLPAPLAETDFCLRARARGYRVVCSPHARVRLDGHNQPPAGFLGSASALFHSRWHETLSTADPYFNPNLRMADEGEVHLR